MFKFMGIQHLDFVPKGETKPLQGYMVHFSDDTANENQVGVVPFKCFITYEKAAELFHVFGASQMNRLSEYVGKPCYLAFNRKGKVDGVSFEEPAQSPAPQFPADPDAKGIKPNKLGGIA